MRTRRSENLSSKVATLLRICDFVFDIGYFLYFPRLRDWVFLVFRIFFTGLSAGTLSCTTTCAFADDLRFERRKSFRMPRSTIESGASTGSGCGRTAPKIGSLGLM